MLSFAFFSCDRFLEFGGEESLDGFDPQLNEPRLVIEAYINDVDTIQRVKLSKTVNLKSDESIEIVQDAEVTVSTSEGIMEYNYVDSLQEYIAQYTGIPDVNYFLEVNWQNKTFTAQAEMANLQQFEIDSIEIRKAKFDFSHWRYFDPEAPFSDYEDEEILLTKDDSYEINDTLPGGRTTVHHVIYLDPRDNTFLTEYKYGDLAEFWFGPEPYVINAAEEGEIMNVYKIFMYAKESQIEENYYRFDVKRFGRSWLQPGQIIVADDFAVGENIDGIEFPGYFVQGDAVQFYMYGISREAYNYYTSLLNTMQNDGGGFSPPPGNPITNIQDENGDPGIGFFEVARVASIEKIVE